MATRNRRNLFTKVRHITGRGRTAKSQPCLTGRRPIPAPPSQIKSIAHTTYCPRATGGPLAYRRKNVHALQDTTSRPWERDPSRFHPLGNQVSHAKVQTIKKQMTPHEDRTGEAYVCIACYPRGARMSRSRHSLCSTTLRICPDLSSHRNGLASEEVRTYCYTLWYEPPLFSSTKRLIRCTALWSVAIPLSVCLNGQ